MPHGEVVDAVDLAHQDLAAERRALGVGDDDPGIDEAAVLGNPVNSVLWLRSKGVTFKPGDIVSVGSMGPLLFPDATGGKATATYDGLPGNPSISVTFN